MSSTAAGTPPEAGDGRPAAEPPERRGLRDRPLGRVLLLLAVLALALVVARSCGQSERNVTQEDAIELATEAAPFEPCDDTGCVQIRYLNQGIPVQGYWAIVLSDEIVDGRPTRVASYLVNVTTGEVRRT